MPKKPYTINLMAEHATELALTGGKGSSLGRMIEAGFPVPPGFVVATSSYTEFIASVSEELNKILQDIDYSNAEHLEEQTTNIRQLIVDTAIPDDITNAISDAYAKLGGDGTFVAVRSSGTAEDLAEASFAGLHDTYLDVHGEDEVLRAVRECWASLWTSRAVQYRHDNGFAHEEVKIAVVVQRMVKSDIAGVIFTANPHNLRTDEIVINANWGLGESVVSGIATPDQYIVARKTLKVKNRWLGSKEVQIVRNPKGQGVRHISVPDEQRDSFTLDDAQVEALAELGSRVMAYYGGLPQDLEWAYEAGKLYLLQSRPITGAEFTWDEDINDRIPNTYDEDTVWTAAWADDFLTGGLTPLYFSVRVSGEFQRAHDYTNRIFDFPIAGKLINKYWRGTSFFNCNVERDWNLLSKPPMLRQYDYVPHTWDEEIRSAGFDWLRFARMLINLHQQCPQIGVLHWFSDEPGGAYDFMKNQIEESNGPTPEQLRAMSDEELQRQFERTGDLCEKWLLSLWTGFDFWAVISLGMLGVLLEKWYNGSNESAYQDLISGVPDTLLVAEARDQWDLAQSLRKSHNLVKLLEKYEGADFFESLTKSAEGQAFLTEYREFLRNHGHRGSQDRDFYYKRRVEDPTVDYEMLCTYMKTDEESSPYKTQERMIARREESTSEVLANIREKSDGEFKALVFQVVLGYAHKFLKLRDDERHHYDRISLQTKRVYAELGRRMYKRGLFEEADDFFFLCKEELRDVLLERDQRPLTHAKVKARKRVFHRRNQRKEWTPAYLIGGDPSDMKTRPEALAEALSDGDEAKNGLCGAGTSAGTVTGRACVVQNLQEIGRLKTGDILITNSTDPGWTPVFAVIGGLVLETGGLLAHGACLSREYGKPAVLLPNAIKLIPDGSVITINGSNGQVIIEEETTPT